MAFPGNCTAGAGSHCRFGSHSLNPSRLGVTAGVSARIVAGRTKYRGPMNRLQGVPPGRWGHMHATREFRKWGNRPTSVRKQKSAPSNVVTSGPDGTMRRVAVQIQPYEYKSFCPGCVRSQESTAMAKKKKVALRKKSAAGRPLSAVRNSVDCTVRMPARLKKAVEKLAREEGVSFAEIIRIAAAEKVGRPTLSNTTKRASRKKTQKASASNRPTKKKATKHKKGVAALVVDHSASDRISEEIGYESAIRDQEYWRRRGRGG